MGLVTEPGFIRTDGSAQRRIRVVSDDWQGHTALHSHPASLGYTWRPSRISSGQECTWQHCPGRQENRGSRHFPAAVCSTCWVSVSLRVGCVVYIILISQTRRLSLPASNSRRQTQVTRLQHSRPRCRSSVWVHSLSQLLR